MQLGQYPFIGLPSCTLTQSRHRYLGHPSFSVYGDKRDYSAPLIHLGKYPFIGLHFKLSPILRDTATSMTQKPSAKPSHPSLPRHRVPKEGLRQGSSPRGGFFFIVRSKYLAGMYQTSLIKQRDTNLNLRSQRTPKGLAYSPIFSIKSSYLITTLL